MTGRMSAFQGDEKRYIIFLQQLFVSASSNRTNIEEVLRDNLHLLNKGISSFLPLLFDRYKRMGVPEQDILGITINISSHIKNYSFGNRIENIEIAIKMYEIVVRFCDYQIFPDIWALANNHLGSAYSDRITGIKKDNIECSIRAFKQVLNNHVFDADPQQWTMAQYNLGVALQNRILGEKINNIELAIQSFLAALKTLTKESFPYQWAVIQNNLCTVYCERIKGKKKDNVERAIEYCQNALEIIKSEAFPYDYAKAMNNIGLAYYMRIEGNKKDNIERAINSFQAAFKVYNYEFFPYEWARTQSNISIAYWKRIEGNKKDNIENTITACKAALEVYKKEFFPNEWAMAKTNLAIGYYERIVGNRKDNIELAIESCQAALEVHTCENFPYEWARLNDNLANAYCERICGNKDNNIELAIQAFQKALEVYTSINFPYEWANTCRNLANAYYENVKGDRSHNIELAIKLYQKALGICTFENFPYEWASIQNNIGNAYLDKSIEIKVKNIELAIKSYQAALEVHTRKDFPYEWARIQINLSRAYLERNIIDKNAKNIELAIQANQLALEVYTRKDFPYEWAKTQNQLASVYAERIKGDREQSIKLSINCYRAALEIYNREKFPYEWAIAQNNLGFTYYEEMIKGNKENTSSAIEALRAALEIFSPEIFPHNHVRTSTNLGNLFFVEDRWKEAISMYCISVKSIESLRNNANYDNLRKGMQTQALSIYNNLILACLKTKQIDRAIEWNERFRSRMLVDIATGKKLIADASNSKIMTLTQQYEAIQAIVDLEKQYFTNKLSSKHLVLENDKNITKIDVQEYTEKIKEREREKQVIFEEIRKTDPVLAGEIQVEALEFEQIRRLVGDSQTAIVSFYAIGEEIHVFIVYQNRESQHYVCRKQETDLKTWIYKHWLEPYQVAFDTGKLKGKAKEQREKRRQRWIGSVSVVMRELTQRLNLNYLIEEYLQGIEELIIIPHGYLHNIPFTALPISESEFLNDRFRIRYAPSCQILKFCQDRKPVADVTYGTVEDADGSLPGARLEGQKVAQLFDIPEENRLIGKEQSTVTEYRQLARRIQALHSSHHALSRLDNPLESALQLANGSITLGELLLWRLDDLEEVFLSCCETNLGVAELTDDFLTLASGFLCAGARGVVSSLWVADDLSAILLSTFYYQLRKAGKSRSAALQQAQQKLRKLTGEELAQLLRCDLKPYKDYLEEKFKQANTKWRNASRQLKKLEAMDCENKNDRDWEKEKTIWGKRAKKYRQAVKNLEEMRCKEEFPFANPYYWAVFICSGLA